MHKTQTIHQTADLFEALPQAEVELFDDTQTSRSEKRENTVGIVEYSHYPRIERGEHKLVAFTRNQSISGMCLVTTEPEKCGALLRVGRRTVDGLADLDALAHVMWCEARPDGRYWIGLALLEPTARRARSVEKPESFATRRERALNRHKQPVLHLARSA